jgi:hypothetical protein
MFITVKHSEIWFIVCVKETQIIKWLHINYYNDFSNVYSILSYITLCIGCRLYTVFFICAVEGFHYSALEYKCSGR